MRWADIIDFLKNGISATGEQPMHLLKKHAKDLESAWHSVLGTEGYTMSPVQQSCYEIGAGSLSSLWLRRLGLRVTASQSARGNQLLLPKDKRLLRGFRIHFGGTGNLVAIGGVRGGRATLGGCVECHGDSGSVIVGDGDYHHSRLEIRLWGRRQLVFWGSGSTSNNSSIVVTGDEQSVIIGDECMFSVNCWLRNTDQHALIDTASGRQLNFPFGSIAIGPRVWLGQDTLVLGACKIGRGSVVGAKSLVNCDVAANTLVAGIPARVLRTGTAWDRSLLVSGAALTL